MDAASLGLWPTPNCWILSVCCRTGWPFRGDLEWQEWAKQTLSYRHPAPGSKALHWHKLGSAQLGTSSPEGGEGPGEQEGKAEHSSSGSKLALHQSCCLCSCSSGWPRISLYSALVHLHLHSVSSFVPHSSRRIWEYWVCSENGQQDSQALSISSEDRLRARGLFEEQKV